MSLMNILSVNKKREGGQGLHFFGRMLLGALDI